jgi:hypothetical protein
MTTAQISMQIAVNRPLRVRVGSLDFLEVEGAAVKAGHVERSSLSLATRSCPSFKCLI